VGLHDHSYCTAVALDGPLRRASIIGSVVDDDHLGVRPGLGERALDRLADIPRAVEDWNDNRNQVARARHDRTVSTAAYIASAALRLRRTFHRCSTTSRLRTAAASTNASSVAARVMACASAATSCGSTIMPSTPDRSHSSTHAVAATIGKAPSAMASSVVVPMPSEMPM